MNLLAFWPLPDLLGAAPGVLSLQKFSLETRVWAIPRLTQVFLSNITHCP